MPQGKDAISTKPKTDISINTIQETFMLCIQEVNQANRLTQMNFAVTVS